MENHFVKAPSEYKRNLDVLGHYVRDAATYLHKQTGRPLDQCVEYVKGKVREPGTINNPPTLVLERNRYGDREKKVIPLLDHIKDVEENNRIISPTMAVYHKPEDKPSILSEFISHNIDRRKKSKKEMFQAKVAGDKAMATFKNNEQASFKISNNSLSGAQASTSTILYNKSAHSSLTSTCRVATSYGNANNEKFLYGNRHYWSPEIVKGNIVSIINSTDYDLLSKAMEKHGIRHPTPQEVCDSIRYSTDLYWKNEVELQRIFDFVEKLAPIELSAFLYTGDLYHLAKYNDGVVREFLGRLSSKAKVPLSVEEADDYIGAMDDDMKAFVSSLCAKELAGFTLKDIRENNAQGYGIVGGTAKNVVETLNEYQLLIKGLWRADTLPASVAHIRSSIRRGVITSDTDSTIFTVQDWVKWYTGAIGFDEQSDAIFYSVVYLATQTITHLLALVSAGMGVREKHIHTLAMKNEFAFPVFVLTSMAKHYFAYISAQEGNVYKEYDIEIKGVYLKDSNAPPYVMDAFHQSLRWTMDKVIEGKGLNITDLLKKVAGIEKDVEASVRRGDSFYLTNGQVKDYGSYKNPESSPYTHYEMWRAVFAPKYGDAPQPPYSAVKVSVNLNNKTKIDEWLSGLPDAELAGRMRQWLESKKKSAITSLLLPRPIIEAGGLPDEVIRAMDIRKLIYSTVKPFYFLLEALGVYMINDDLTKLVSDNIDP
mgnify:CR=1 FL=1